MLRASLKSVRRSADVGRLFTALGYRPADVPFDGSAHVRARWHGFQVVAGDSVPPTEGARVLARRLATQGERGLAVCVGAGQLAIAAPRPGTSDATRALVIDLVNPSRLALSQLETLAPTRSRSALAHALRVAEALSAEAAGDRFFRGFRAQWQRMADSVPATIPAAERRLVALVTLTRMLFLYFVQAKGWLDRNRSYLRALLDRTVAEGGHFHRDALEPLFFRTLNRAPARRDAASAGIPYLNGGLFEPHPLERQFGSTVFPNAIWVDAFDDLFDRYHFCVHEAHSVDAVAPDMLGRVFERLMESDERSRTGTYFTPEKLVRGVVLDGLHAALPQDHWFPVTSVERLLGDQPLAGQERHHAASRLRALKILDPAAGSGAFLLGALDALTELNLRVSGSSDPRTLWNIRRRVLRENLFGVDVNPFAVRLAELRLWLAVVADDPATTPPDVEPLPNLDGVVRQGDTLVDPVGTARAHLPDLPFPSPALTRRVAEARARVFTARGAATKAAMQELREGETALARETLDRAVVACEYHLREARALALHTDLFGNCVPLTPTQEARRRALEADLADLERVRAEVRQGGLPFFAFEIHVPEVLRGGGFDLVIGNPPWVRAEHLAPRTRKRLRRRFTCWKAGHNRGYRHLPDLSIAFLERAVELAKPGGTVALLLPAKLTSAGYGETIRTYVANETTIVRIHRILETEGSRFGATTYPLELVLRKTTPDPDHRTLIGAARRESLTQCHLKTQGPWILVPDPVRDSVEVFLSSGQPLHALAEPHLGVKTGADRLLVGTVVAEVAGAMHVRFPDGGDVMLEHALLRPALRGRDVRPHGASLRRVVLWAYDEQGSVRPTLPPSADAYVTQHAAALGARADHRSGALWTLYRTGPAFQHHRVAWPDIATTVAAVALDEVDSRAIPLNTCYVAAFPDQATALAVSTILNSIWISAFVQVTADEARGGYRRCNSRIMGRIPVPEPRRRTPLTNLGRRAHHTDNVRTDEIDAAVAAALDLPRSVQSQLRSLARAR